MDLPYKIGDLVGMVVESDEPPHQLLYGYISHIVDNTPFVYLFQFERHYCLEGRTFNQTWYTL